MGDTWKEKVMELQGREVTPIKSLLEEAVLEMGQAGWVGILLSTFHLSSWTFGPRHCQVLRSVEWPYELTWLIPFPLANRPSARGLDASSYHHFILK